MIYQDIERICKNPLASAFIFTYNQECLVQETIESILSQKCNFEYEIVICEDCGTDNTLDVCLKYQKEYPQLIRVIHNDKNLGLRANFFENITTYARGKYVAVCAGDDWWCDEEKLQKQVGFLEQHSDYGMVHTLASVYIDKEKRMRENTIGSPKNTFFDNILNNHVAALTMCFSKVSFDEYINEINPVELPYSEDYPMVLWYSYRSKIHFLNEVTCVYRLLENSVSHSTNLEKIYKGPLDFYTCGQYFIKLFGVEDELLMRLSTFKYYRDRMRWAFLLNDKVNIRKGEAFFGDYKYYSFWLLSKLYGLSGSNVKLNRIIFFIERVIRRFHPTRKYFI